MHVLRELLDGRPVDFHGDDLDLTLDPPRIRPANGCPSLYFGGLSDNAREVAAQAADVFLMWPDTLEGIADTIADVRARADRHGRQLRFGYRAHVIVRYLPDDLVVLVLGWALSEDSSCCSRGHGSGEARADAVRRKRPNVACGGAAHEHLEDRS